MTTLGAKARPQVIGVVTAALFYALSFWRIARRNRGNKVIECGTMAIMVTIAMVFLSRFIDLPDWAFSSLLALIFLLCTATLFFLAQRAYRALCHRRAEQ